MTSKILYAFPITLTLLYASNVFSDPLCTVLSYVCSIIGGSLFTFSNIGSKCTSISNKYIVYVYTCTYICIVAVFLI